MTTYTLTVPFTDGTDDTATGLLFEEYRTAYGAICDRNPGRTVDHTRGTVWVEEPGPLRRLAEWAFGRQS